jgi:hypothetical protein
MKGIFYISVNNFVKKIFKTNLETAKKLENKYVIFKINMKKHIYENDHFSYVHEKKIITYLVFLLFTNLP